MVELDGTILDEETKRRLENLVIKEEVRKQLRNRIKTFRPLRVAEKVSLVFFGLFFAYYGLRSTGLLERFGLPEAFWVGNWQFSICIAMSIVHIFNIWLRRSFRKNILEEEFNEILDQLDEVHGSWGMQESGRDINLVKEAIDSTETVLFRGDNGFLWSAGLAVAFLIFATVELIRF